MRAVFWRWFECLGFFPHVVLIILYFHALVQYKTTVFKAVVWQHLRKDKQPCIWPLLTSSLCFQLWKMWLPVFKQQFSSLWRQILTLKTLADLRLFLVSCKLDTELKFLNMLIEQGSCEPFFYSAHLSRYAWIWWYKIWEKRQKSECYKQKWACNRWDFGFSSL